jgi:hypothetical protein
LIVFKTIRRGDSHASKQFGRRAAIHPKRRPSQFSFQFMRLNLPR